MGTIAGDNPEKRTFLFDIFVEHERQIEWNKSFQMNKLAN